MREFMMLKKIHDMRVAKSEKKLLSFKQAHQETIKAKEKALEQVSLEEQNLLSLQNDMDTAFRSMITRSDIELWRARVAKQRQAISEAKVMVKEADVKVQEAKIALNNMVEEHKLVEQKRDKIVEILKEVKQEHDRFEEDKEERDAEP